MAQEVHREIRFALDKLAGKQISNTVRIIYGGSVNAENCAALAAEAGGFDLVWLLWLFCFVCLFSD
jgi:triosephosphate isomerase